MFCQLIATLTPAAEIKQLKVELDRLRSIPTTCRRLLDLIAKDTCAIRGYASSTLGLPGCRIVELRVNDPYDLDGAGLR